jgi:hypothetical protein
MHEYVCSGLERLTRSTNPCEARFKFARPGFKFLNEHEAGYRKPYGVSFWISEDTPVKDGKGDL